MSIDLQKLKRADEGRLAFPVIVGDIGGTNARFAVVAREGMAEVPLPRQRTADHPDLQTALATALAGWDGAPPRSAVFALAGPVIGSSIPLTNCPWVVEPPAILTALGLSTVLAINDFEGQALAVAALPPEAWTTIRDGTAEEGAPRIVLGPGTGLGVGGMVRAGHRWVTVPGEGGHMDLGPRTEEESALWPHLHALAGPRISGETVLCGRGILLLHRAVCALHGAPVVHATQEAVTAAGLDGSDPLAVETLQRFAVLLGRVAGDVALVFGARGGAFIAGGIAPILLPVLRQGGLAENFDDKWPHREWMARIPIHLVVHEAAALAGLAAFAQAPDDFALRTEGRIWHG